MVGMASPPVVRQATIHDLDVVAPLFDAYRVFYRKPSDLAAARAFLLARFSRLESVIFLAFDGDSPNSPAGFTQLYPSFSSASLAPILVLNDLYVEASARGRGVGQALLHAAADYGRRAGAVRLTLSTERTNLAAQSLYQANGWTLEEAFLNYNLVL